MYSFFTCLSSGIVRVRHHCVTDNQRREIDVLEVWHTTGMFINYKSQVLLPAGAEIIIAKASGEPCSTRSTIPQGITFKDCEISLEDVARRFSGNTYNGLPISFQFINCVVDYHGGPLPDGPMEFSDSVFHFYVTVVPSPRGAEAMRSLAQAESDEGKVPENSARHS
ncbi:MAG: hypothetical protein WB341_05765 [Terracidiphilus sp.]